MMQEVVKMKAYIRFVWLKLADPRVGHALLIGLTLALVPLFSPYIAHICPIGAGGGCGGG